MNISKIEIYNFRGHKETKVNLSKNYNLLVGPNNSGKTSFLQAINLVIGFNRQYYKENDFFADVNRNDPKKSEPIKIILEFAEINDDKFPESVIQEFGTFIQFNTEESDLTKDVSDTPLRYFRICYECAFDDFENKFKEYRYFVDKSNNKFKKTQTSDFTYKHSTFVPFFYLQSLRDIKKELSVTTSFWGKIKNHLNNEFKEEENIELKDLLDKIHNLDFSNNKSFKMLLDNLKEIKNNLKISNKSSDVVFLNAFPQNTWELFENLDIYLKNPDSNLTISISEHGEGIQNIIYLLIFKAYIEIILPNYLENKDVTPIIGIEEPEAHLHPHLQKSLFHEILEIKGQKIISTHSPYLVEQSEIYNYVIFNLNGGISDVKKVPYYKPSFNYRPNLPKEAYENNKFFTDGEEIMIKRYIQFKNPDLLFSSVFILCEGDSEKIFIEKIAPYYFKDKRIFGRLGVSVISCDGQTYSPFLKISNKESLGLKWVIFSDAEKDTKEKIDNTLTDCGYGDYESKKNSIIFLPDNFDFEKYYISFYKAEKIKEIIYEKFSKKNYDSWLKNKIDNEKDSDKEEEDFILNCFIDSKGKPEFTYHLADHVIKNNLKIPDKIVELFNKIII